MVGRRRRKRQLGDGEADEAAAAVMVLKER